MGEHLEEPGEEELLEVGEELLEVGEEGEAAWTEMLEAEAGVSTSLLSDLYQRLAGLEALILILSGSLPYFCAKS